MSRLGEREMRDAGDADDRRLLDEGDLGTLFAGHWQTVYDRCFLRLRNADAAGEARQRVFERLLKEIRAGRTYPVPFRVVVWNVTKWTLDGLYAPVKSEAELPEQLEEPATDAYANWEFHADFRAAVASLPEGQRVVCELRYFQGLEQAEIAKELGIDRNAVYQRLFNAHKKLRELLRP